MSTQSQGGDFTERDLDLYMMRLLAGWKVGIEKKFKLPDANTYPHQKYSVHVPPKLRLLPENDGALEEDVKCTEFVFVKREFRTLGGVHVRTWVKES